MTIRATQLGRFDTIQHNLNKHRDRLEQLQLKGSNLRALTEPSDNPSDNVQIMHLKTMIKNTHQYIKNIHYANRYHRSIEQSLEELHDLLLEVKVIALSESSDLASKDLKNNTIEKIEQLKLQMIAIGNKKLDQKYLFAGFSTLKPPFDERGTYLGDREYQRIEIAENLFIPINVPGFKIFEEKEGRSFISLLDTLVLGLKDNDSKKIQSLLKKFDNGLSGLLTLRTKIGSLQNLSKRTLENLNKKMIEDEELKSQLFDVDLSKLFSDIARQQDILKTSMQSSKKLINQTLLDFLR